MDSIYLDYLEQCKDVLYEMADYLHDHPEVSFKEELSSSYLISAFEKEGFVIERDLAGIKTAFSARFGTGKPVIGILGEYDALAGLGQDAGVFHKSGDSSRPGHGCGHHLLGTAAFGAAIGLKNYLCATGKQGTVIFFGCPAEENGSGKAFMARDHVFDGIDVALTWHPDSSTGVRNNTSLANVQVIYSFDGTPAHAAAAPFMGRSALDGVELMNVGVNYLREHMLPAARVHYAVIDSGGNAANVVQAHAEVLYLIRAPHAKDVLELKERVTKIAKGAAMMTETEVKEIFIKGCSETLLNQVLNKAAYEAMKKVDLPELDQEDLDNIESLLAQGLKGIADEKTPVHLDLEELGPVKYEYGSTDVGDVSWICPTVQIKSADYLYGTPGHSWQLVAQGKLPLAHKMCLYTAKALTQLGIDLIEDPQIIEDAWKQRKEDGDYLCPIPQGVLPDGLNRHMNKMD